MRLDDYQAAARRTMGTSKPPDQALGYFALGLVGEAIEVLDVVTGLDHEEIVGELGDVAWYAAALADCLGVRLREAQFSAGRWYETNVAAAIGLACCAGEIAEHAKKVWGHGHPLATHEPMLVDLLIDVLDTLRELAEGFGTTLECVLDANVAKLRARYPDGFTREASINRVV